MAARSACRGRAAACASHRYADGLCHHEALAMCVSRSVGTTFVSFRIFARPEVTVMSVVGRGHRSYLLSRTLIF